LTTRIVDSIAAIITPGSIYLMDNAERKGSHGGHGLAE
jgi:hypothetical protein